MDEKQYHQFTDNLNEAYDLLDSELNKAMEKFKWWPKDPIHAVGIMEEESGETMKAALQNVYDRKSDEEIIKEAAQTGAMAIRVIMGILDNRT